MKPLFLLLLILICFAATISAGSQEAQKLDPRLIHGSFSFRAGLLNIGTVHVRNRATGAKVGDFETKTGIVMGTMFDIPVYRRWMMSIQTDILDVLFMDERGLILDVSAAVKYTTFNQYSKIAVRPGLAVGFAYLAELGFLEKVRFMTIRGFTEIIFLSNRNLALFTDISVFSAPIGFNRIYEVTTNPFVILRVGVLF